MEQNHAPVVIGALMGNVDAKIIDISNTFPMSLKTKGENTDEPAYNFDTEYLKKMLKFHKNLNDQEHILGVYVSSTEIDKTCMVVVSYFKELFMSQKVKSPLQMPIIMLFDPELKNNKLDIKVSN